MELETESLKRKVAFNLLDLRWGITAEESKQGLVTEMNLHPIQEDICIRNALDKSFLTL